MEIARYLDHAILKPEMTQDEVKAAIQIGIDNNVKTVCMQPRDIKLAQEMCKGTNTEVITVLDFPHGCATPEAKEALAGIYADMGVAEIDMVMNYGYARSGLWDEILREVSLVVNKSHAKSIPVKVIFETSELTLEEVAKATEICIEAGADFVKTSTGFSKEGATHEKVKCMLDTAKGRIKVKPSGGVRNYEQAKAYADMGVDRIGNGFSSTEAIVKGEKEAQ